MVIFTSNLFSDLIAHSCIFYLFTCPGSLKTFKLFKKILSNTVKFHKHIGHELAQQMYTSAVLMQGVRDN